MFILDIPEGRGWSASYRRAAEDVIKQKTIINKYWIRFGEGGPGKVNWLCQVVVHSADQARSYAEEFRKMAEKIEKEEAKLRELESTNKPVDI